MCGGGAEGKERELEEEEEEEEEIIYGRCDSSLILFVPSFLLYFLVFYNSITFPVTRLAYVFPLRSGPNLTCLILPSLQCILRARCLFLVLFRFVLLWNGWRFL